MQLLLDDVRPAVVALSETEVMENDVVFFKNYKVFYPLLSPTGKFRLLLLLREDWATKCNPKVLSSSTMGIWMKLEAPGCTFAIGSIYRQWTALEEEELVQLCDQITEIAGEYDRVLIMGDVNLDVARMEDSGYYRRRLLKILLGCLDRNELSLANLQDMSPTYHSHGTFDNGNGSVSRRTSVLDHIYFRGLPTPSFYVLPTAMTDHRPVLARFSLWQQVGELKTILRRNFKSVSTHAITMAINAEALSGVFAMDDVEEIHDTIVSEISAALDLVAPLEQVQVKNRRTPLYLTSETCAVIRERDRAAALGDHTVYRRLRNKAARLVKRDRVDSNLKHLQDKGLDPKSVWELANAVSGRSARSALPAELLEEDSDGNDSSRRIRGDSRLADCVNKFYVDKVDKIRAKIDKSRADDTLGTPPQQQRRPQQQQQQQQQRWQQQQRRQRRQQQQHGQRQQQRQQQQQMRFKFRPPTEKEVHSVILGLNNTRALGIDGIPVAILKQLAPILAAPTAHLIKVSFESASVPSGFKKALVIPLHKRNKPPHLASSYRPVALLAAFSKVLERVVLQQVSPHLAPLLPQTQFGFRPKRSTSVAIAYSHGCWSAARARGLTVAVAGYDLSSAFDTVDVDMVSDKLRGFGIVDRENRWFLDYLSNRMQQVQYNSSRSSFRNVRYGVPQGSILGPLLFLVLVSDLPAEVSSLASDGMGGIEVGISAYADDVLCWVMGRNSERLKEALEQVSSVIVSYTNRNYLALNEQKTQVLWSSCQGLPVQVGTSTVSPSDKLDVLGVTFDRQLTPGPHLNSLIMSTKSMTAVARRLALHLPVDLLKTVMGALVQGRIGYACLALPPRFKPSDPANGLISQLQIGMNDVARATVGSFRSDRLKVEDLLQEAGFISVNRMTIYAIAMECWRALNLRDVPDGPLNPLGTILSRPNLSHPNLEDESAPRTRTRSVASGCLPPPTKHQVSSFIWWAHTCWNLSPLLRSATTVSAAKRAAKELAEAAPF